LRLIGSGCEEAVTCETQRIEQAARLHRSPSKRQGLVTVVVLSLSMSP